MDVLLIVVGAEVVPELIVPTGAPVPRLFGNIKRLDEVIGYGPFVGYTDIGRQQ